MASAECFTCVAQAYKSKCMATYKLAVLVSRTVTLGRASHQNKVNKVMGGHYIDIPVELG